MRQSPIVSQFAAPPLWVFLAFIATFSLVLWPCSAMAKTVLGTHLAASLTPTELPVAATAEAPPTAHGADLPPREVRAQTWDVSGQLELSHTAGADFGDDDVGTRSGQAQVGQARLIAGGRTQLGERTRLDLELETHSAALWGDPLTLGQGYTSRPFSEDRAGTGDLARVLPRKAAVTVRTDVGQFSFGFQTFTWGTGMVANDGAGAQQADGPQFGSSRLGNIVLRGSYALKPLRDAHSPFWRSLAAFIAADGVLRDDNASWLDGDRAYSGVLGVRAEDAGDALGLLVSTRSQLDRYDAWRPDDASVTRVVVLDGYGKKSLELTPGQRILLEGEVAGIFGRSTRPYGEETFKKGAAVVQLGAVGRVRWDHDPSRLSTHLELGYASGDNDPRDANARQFTMHSDHNVGLLLFERVLPAVSARSVDRLADGQLVAQPPASARFAINQGAVQNAAYMHPVVRWRPLQQLELRLGWLFAVAASDVMDAYQTGVHGGFATTPGGQVRGGRVYGHEFDARAAWTQPLPGKLAVRVGAEGGVFLPGAAFDGVLDLGTPWLARGFLALGW